MQKSQTMSSRNTGPVRTRLAKLSPPLPYARDSSAAAVGFGERSEAREEGLLARVKSIVSWLVPGWLSSPQKQRPQTVAPMRPESPLYPHIGDQRMFLDDENMPTDTIMDQTGQVVTAEVLLERILSGKSPRAVLYEELAQFFELKAGLNVCLTQDEYEKLSYVIQRQEAPRPRPPPVTPLPQMRPSSSIASLSSATRGRTVRQSPRRAPSLASAADQYDMPDELSAIPPAPVFARPPPKPRKAKVYSARFDDDEEFSVTLPGPVDRERRDDVASTKLVVSENRKKLVEEARLRVAEQIRQAQLPPNVKDSTELPLVPEKKEPAPASLETKPAFSFTISAPGSAESAKPSMSASLTSSEAPKMGFDFGSAISVDKETKDKVPPPASPALLSFEPPKNDQTKPSALSLEKSPTTANAKSASESKSLFSFGAESKNGKPFASTTCSTGLGFSVTSKEAEEKMEKPTVAFSIGPTPIASEPAPSSLFNALATPTKSSFSFSFTQGPSASGETNRPVEADNREATTGPAPKIDFGTDGSAMRQQVPCGTTLGSSLKTSEQDTGSKAPFSFGPNPPPEAKSPFLFGSLAAPADSKPVFSFGSAAPPVSAEATAPKATSAFSFGGSAPESKAEVSGGSSGTGSNFTFGSSLSSDPKPAYSFATPAAATNTATATGSKPAFSFGPTTTAPTAPAAGSKPAFCFGPTTTATTTGTGTAFSFGSAPQPSSGTATGASPFAFGSTTPSSFAFGNAPIAFEGDRGNEMSDSNQSKGPAFGSQPETRPTAFNFGSTTNAAPSGFGTPSSMPSTGLSFGVPAATPNSTNNAAPPAGSVAPLNFNFGAPAPTGSSSFTFGSGTSAGSGGFSAGSTNGPRKFSVPQRRKK